MLEDRRIFYFTTVDPTLQGDFQEVMTLIGLRNVFGDKVIDFPKKGVLYGDFSESPKEKLHGRGFTLYKYPIADIPERPDPSTITENDVIIYGVTNAYGITDYPEYNKLTKNIFYIDGHDDPNIKKTPCFKRELYSYIPDVFPFGFCIPQKQIREINFDKKNQIYAKSAPPHCFSDDPDLRKSGLNYIFDNEEDYYDDLSKSWFGLTCLKGGWDSLRTYEIVAAGTLAIFKHYNRKPQLCSPQGFPCYFYSTLEELRMLMYTLVQNGTPTKKYIEMLNAQRNWLAEFGTCEKSAVYLVETIEKYINEKT